MRAILIATWQGVDGFQKSLRPCALDKSSHIIVEVKPVICGCIYPMESTFEQLSQNAVIKTCPGIREC